MSKVNRIRSPKSRSTRPFIRPATFRARGQALVEYALITALLVIAIMVALAATGPAVGNVFSNTVFNLIGGSAPSITPLNPTQFWQLVTAVASYTPSSIILPTNTLAPATSTPTQGTSRLPLRNCRPAPPPSPTHPVLARRRMTSSTTRRSTTTSTTRIGGGPGRNPSSSATIRGRSNGGRSAAPSGTRPTSKAAWQSRRRAPARTTSRTSSSTGVTVARRQGARVPARRGARMTSPPDGLATSTWKAIPPSS